MERNKEKMMFVTFTGPSGGTMMESALKQYAKEKYDSCLIRESQFATMVEDIKNKERELKVSYAKWKDVLVSSEDNSHGLGTEIVTRWVFINSVEVLRANVIRHDYREHMEYVNLSLVQNKRPMGITDVVKRLNGYWNKDITIVVRTGVHETQEIPLVTIGKGEDLALRPNRLEIRHERYWDILCGMEGSTVEKTTKDMDRMGNETVTIERYWVDNVMEIKEGVDGDALLI